MRKHALIVLLATITIAAAALYMIYGELQLPWQPDSSAKDPGSFGTGSIRINEVMASNPGYFPDQNGEFYDWIELYNSSDQQVNLAGYGLSDTAEQVKWVAPSDLVIPAKGFLMIYCSGSEQLSDSGDAYVDFKIKAEEESVVLTNPLGQVIDMTSIPEVAGGASIARSAEVETEWMESSLPTPGFHNNDEGRAEYESSMKTDQYEVVINEVQPSNVSTYAGEKLEYPDWIELFNPGSSPLDLSGFGLTDNKLKPLKWTFPEGTSIAPGEYLLVFADGTIDVVGELEGHYANFKLNSYSESLSLTDRLGRTIDLVEYTSVPSDASIGRGPEGDLEVFVHPTPGFENTESGYEQFLATEVKATSTSKLFISEIMLTNRTYSEDGGEFYDWVELHNSGDQPIDLAGYTMSDNIKNPGKWPFPDGTTIAAGEYLVLQASSTSIADAKKKSSEYLHLNFALDNISGEIVSLWDKDGNLIDNIASPPQLRESTYGRDATDQPYRYYVTPTPGAANATGYVAYMPQPTIILESGFYSGRQSVAIEKPTSVDGIVRYTLDGSEPSESSPEYTEPIEIDQTRVVRARYFSDDSKLLPSATVSASYIIDNPHSSALSIVSLSTDPDNFFDDENGIYVMGNGDPGPSPYMGANFWIKDWEKPVHVDIFDPSGKLEISQDAAIRIFGAYSRARDQKGLALIARSQYGTKSFDYPLFENRPFDSYKSIVLRAGGNDTTVTKIHDIVATSLVDGTTNLKVQAYRQAVVYLNGDYFGIYNIREKITKYWIAQHYGLRDADNIDLLYGNATESATLVGDNKAYMELLEFCKNNDLSDQSNFDHVASLIDVDNYIDYLICEMYSANTDTGNIKFFRERSDDPERSKFRWIYYDFCWGFIKKQMDSFEYLTNPEGHGTGKFFSTQLTRSLLQNQQFRNDFLRRFAELLNTIYTPENVLAKIEECEAAILEEMPRAIERWAEPGFTSVNHWKSNMRVMKEFAAMRRDYCIGFLRVHFSLSESDAVRIFGSAGVIPDSLLGQNQEPEIASGSAE